MSDLLHIGPEYRRAPIFMPVRALFSSMLSFIQPLLVRRRCKLCLLLSVVGSLFILPLFYGTVLRDLGYLTRPLWDKPQKPFNVISHYDNPNVPIDRLCALHGWH
ncbi:hypothetical protein AcW1_005744 [Taiwanofungus camphoratus]|nr:hypothetical protein AcW2_004507 [Antrodia cinnamomea]KAI0934116.1 hypothetical protein AcV5_006070 [Antrodia cinnamomea]KAI0950583.1 hypothetical protein AcV7_009002 [Antrodia cinnamomea]KAI0957311.1 hypothetical protein AcW1_005744 [Antrodia cinnamomea]